MSRGDFILKWLAYGLALFAAALIQVFFLARFPLFGVSAVLLPLTAAAVGILEGPASGAGYGIAVGVFASAMCHGSLWLCAFYALAGYLIGLVGQYLRQDFWGYCLCSAGLLLVGELWHVLYRLVTGAAALSVLLRVAVPEFLLSMALCIPVFFFFRFLCRHWGAIYHA